MSVETAPLSSNSRSLLDVVCGGLLERYPRLTPSELGAHRDRGSYVAAAVLARIYTLTPAELGRLLFIDNGILSIVDVAKIWPVSWSEAVSNGDEGQQLRLKVGAKP